MSTKMNDGYQTLITIGALEGGVVFWEKGVTPPGMSAGGAIDTTTMRNDKFRTAAPKALITLTNSSLTVAYSSDALEEIYDIVGVEDTITISFPDGGSIAFRGWLDEFTPGENTEGEQPTATITIIPCNVDENGAESEPVFVGEGGATPPTP